MGKEERCFHKNSIICFLEKTKSKTQAVFLPVYLAGLPRGNLQKLNAHEGEIKMREWWRSLMKGRNRNVERWGFPPRSSCLSIKIGKRGPLSIFLQQCRQTQLMAKVSQQNGNHSVFFWANIKCFCLPSIVPARRKKKKNILKTQPQNSFW